MIRKTVFDCFALHHLALEICKHCCILQVGSWSTQTGLDIKDIVWPNESRVPPKVTNVNSTVYSDTLLQGVPEKFSIKITFLEEPPFIMTSDPGDPTRQPDQTARPDSQTRQPDQTARPGRQTRPPDQTDGQTRLFKPPS